jgi:D-alanyl-D-alanine dipeptidase
MKKTLFYILLILIITACNNTEKITPQKQEKDTIIKIDTVSQKKVVPIIDTSDIEKIFIKAGLVNVQSLDSTIRVDIRYASKRNFLGFNMYGNLKRAYLQPYVAQKLVQAHKYLHDTFPNYNFLIFDAARPISIQQMMWDSIKVSAKERPKYLSNPKYGSLHCFGAAVDITIVDSTNTPLDMGTDFDSFEKKAYPILEKKFLKSGVLTQEVVNNRKLLRKVMEKADFFNIQTEWWHFNSCYRKEARKKYAMLLNHKLPKQEVLIAENKEPKKEDELIAEVIKKQEEPIEDVNINFRVQIKTSTRKRATTDKIFQGLDVYRYYHQGLWKYTVGKFKSMKKAYELRDKMRTLGYKDCFIAGFNNDERIGIKSAVELMNE